MQSQAQIISSLRDLKPALSDQYFVTKLGYFGSLGNDTFTNESDLDLLVEFNKPVGWEFFDLVIFLEEKFERKVDLVTVNALKPALKEKILKQTIYL